MLKKCGCEQRSDLESAKNRLRVSAQFSVGRNIVIFFSKHRDGYETDERIVDERHFTGFSLGRRNWHRSRHFRRHLATALRGTHRSEPKLSAAFFHRRHHGASSLAAHGRLRLFLARDRRKQRDRSESDEEQSRHDFGEKSHASVVEVFHFYPFLLVIWITSSLPSKL